MFRVKERAESDGASLKKCGVLRVRMWNTLCQVSCHDIIWQKACLLKTHATCRAGASQARPLDTLCQLAWLQAWPLNTLRAISHDCCAYWHDFWIHYDFWHWNWWNSLFLKRSHDHHVMSRHDTWHSVFRGSCLYSCHMARWRLA